MFVCKKFRLSDKENYMHTDALLVYIIKHL